MRELGYVIGVSTGMFYIARGQPAQAQQYLTVLRKVFWAAQRGVTFAQLDIETIAEFDEPYVMESVRKIRQLGLKFGIHGESAATGAHTMILESAIGDEYKRSHERLMYHIKGAGKLKADYVLIHASESMPINLIGTQKLQSTQIVDFYGRDIRDFLDENPDVYDWAWRQEFIQKISFGRAYYDWEDYLEAARDDYIRQHPEEVKGGLTPEIEEKIKRNARKMFENARRKNVYESPKRPSLSYGSERLAYALVAKWMELRKDPLWIDIVGKKAVFDGKMYYSFQKWVPAVTAKYIWGHFNPLPKITGKYSKSVGAFEDPKPLLEKYDLKWVFEPEMGRTGWEKHMRLVNIPHIYNMVKAIGHPNIKVAIDIEHLLSAGEDPIKNIEKLPYGAGKDIYVIHVGWPTPHSPAHIPLYLGSEAQQYIYDALYKLRQKGWKDGIIIFERGGGDDPVQTSVLAIRKIIKYLVKDVPLDKLPEDFYGLDPNGPEVSRQRVNIQMHAYEPLKGLITQPEEEHGLLGKTAIEKGKGEEWKKEKYK